LTETCISLRCIGRTRPYLLSILPFNRMLWAVLRLGVPAAFPAPAALCETLAEGTLPFIALRAL